VKVYALFCGIKIAYCPEHNYLFRDIQVLNKMAQGKHKKLLKQIEKRRITKKRHNDKKWKDMPTI